MKYQCCKELQFLKDKLTEIYVCGYERGHDDTVEGYYGNIEEKAEEYLDAFTQALIKYLTGEKK